MRPRPRVKLHEEAPVPDATVAASEKPNGEEKLPSDDKPAAAAAKETFWEFLFGLQERWQTEGLSLYCYRLWPVTDSRNPERFLCKLQEAIDEDYLLKHFGSGKYWLVLNDARGKHIRKHVANPHNPDFPPRVSPQEVVDSDPRNKLFFDVWARKDGHSPSADKAGDTGNDAAIRELAGLVKVAFGDQRKAEAEETTKTLINWALSQKDKERAENSPTAVATLVKELKDLIPTPAPAANPLDVVDKVLAIQNRNQTDVERVWKLAERVHARGQTEPAPDPLGQVKTTMEVLGEIREFLKPDTPVAVDGGGMSGWQAMVTSLGQSVSSAIPGIASLIAAWKSPIGAQGPGQAGASYSPPPPRAWNPYQDTAASREYVRQQAAATAATSPMPPPVSQQPPQPISIPTDGQGNPAPDVSANDAYQLAVQQVIPLVSTAISCLHRGLDGGEAADSFAALQGELEYDRLVTQVKASGVESVIVFAKTIPQLSGEVTAYEGQLTQFIREFIEPPQYGEEEAAPVASDREGRGRSRRKPEAVG